MQKDLTTKILALNGAEVTAPNGKPVTAYDLVYFILVNDLYGYRSSPAESSIRFKIATKLKVATGIVDLNETELTLIKILALQFLSVTEAGRIEEWADA